MCVIQKKWRIIFFGVALECRVNMKARTTIIKCCEMNEVERLEELKSLDILDTSPEKDFDDLTLLASQVCDTPISLVTLLDESRQWFKSNLGLDVNETPREDSFCQYTLDFPDHVLVIEDAEHDSRFVSNPLVTGYPGIRFYAGAPLVTSRGNVLGTLCVIDTIPRKISDKKKEALQVLSRKVMSAIELRGLATSQNETIEETAQRLIKLTNKAPLAIYQYEISPDGKQSFPFMSQGITRLHPNLDPQSIMANPEIAFGNIYPEDLPAVQDSIKVSYETLAEWVIEFRTVQDDGSVEWHFGRATPERTKDGTVVWYGTIQNVTSHVEYERAMEQIAFDISHVLRRPVTTLLGLTQLIEGEEEMDEASLKHYVSLIKTVSEEMEAFTHKLNKTYSEKSKIITGFNHRAGDEPAD